MTKFISYKSDCGFNNMKIDSDLLEQAISQNLDYPIFRLYGWNPPCISLGRNQDESFLDRDFLQRNNIDVVRRLTGGRALLHDNEITYSYICPVSYLKNGEHIVSSYKEISQILIDKFKLLGIELGFGASKPVKTGFDYCMLISTGADLCYRGRKLIGSAQYRKQGYILQHGSILYDYNRTLLEEIFKEPVSTDEITSIKEINSMLTKEQIIDILKEG